MELLVLLKDEEVLNSMLTSHFDKLISLTNLLRECYGFGFEYNINDLKVAGKGAMRSAVVNEFKYEGLTIDPDTIKFKWINSSERGISFTNLKESFSEGSENEKGKELFEQLELLTKITNKIYYFGGARDEFKNALEVLINNN